jgi:Fe-S cluster biogenesis protein NfuA
MIETEKKAWIARIDHALDSVRPHLHVDGGDVEVVDLTEEMRVQIKWKGMCESCSMSAFTLRAGIAEAIRTQVPEITGVDALNGVTL